jgi:hypothetical protein
MVKDRHYKRLWHGAMALALLPAWPLGAYGALDSLEAIIDNVRRNERLYDEFDVTIRSVYEIGKREPAKFQGGMTEVVAKALQTHYVSQGEMFRVDVAGSVTNTELTRPGDRVRAFDGTTTRLLDQNQIGNIIAGRAEDSDFIRPHMMLLRSSNIKTPLSTYLSGEDAMKAHPMGNWNQGLHLQVSDQGEAEFQGLNCHRVWITTLVEDGHANDRWELWLAPERNYIPVRLLAWTFRWSSSVPIGEGSVSDWFEIEPGIWFPVSAEFTRYDSIILQQNGRQKMSWREKYIMESASLAPDYDQSYFSDIPFPNGATVYKLQGETVTDSYRVGAPAAVAVGASSYRWWFLGANVAVLAFVLTVLLRRRARRAAAGSRGP